MLFKLPVASVCKHDKAATTMGHQIRRSPTNNQKSKNNSVQASYDLDNKDTRRNRTIE